MLGDEVGKVGVLVGVLLVGDFVDFVGDVDGLMLGREVGVASTFHVTQTIHTAMTVSVITRSIMFLLIRASLNSWHFIAQAFAWTKQENLKESVELFDKFCKLYTYFF